MTGAQVRVIGGYHETLHVVFDTVGRVDIFPGELENRPTRCDGRGLGGWRLSRRGSTSRWGRRSGIDESWWDGGRSGRGATWSGGSRPPEHGAVLFLDQLPPFFIVEILGIVVLKLDRHFYGAVIVLDDKNPRPQAVLALWRGTAERLEESI